MGLMPAYYTTTSTKKRKQKRKPGWEQREAEYQKFLKKHGLDKPQKKREFVEYKPSDSYRREDNLPPCSNAVGNGFKTERPEYTGNAVIGQAYNKGGLQVLSTQEAKDPMTGKRR